MRLVSVVIVLVIGPVDVRPELPEPLQRVMQSHMAQTSEIEWTITYLQGRDAGLVERHITRTAGDKLWQVNLGDENGYHRMAFHSSPAGESEEALRRAAIPREKLAGPRHVLLYEGDVWGINHDQGGRPHLTGSAIPNDDKFAFRPFEFTTSGIGPSYLERGGLFGVHPGLVDGFESAEYTVMTSGHIQTITAEYNGKTIEWQLDVKRGGNPVYAALYSGNRILYASSTDLTQREDRWFPSSISYYLNDDQHPHKVIDFQRVSFDQPDHIRDMTPNDIGVLFGTQLFGPNGVNKWDGTRLITGDEYDELIYIDGLRPHPYVVEDVAEAMHMSVEEYLARMDRTMEQRRARYLEEHGEAPWLAKKSDEPDPWDLYVAEFIKKHKLDDPRIKQANDLLKKAKKLRDYHQRKNRSEIAKTRRADDTEKLAHYEQISERLFQKVLVHGLEKLLPLEREKAGNAGT